MKLQEIADDTKPAKPPKTIQQIMDDIRTRPTVPLWPHVGKALGVSRGKVYALAHDNKIQTIKLGSSFRAITAPLRQQLGLEG